MQTLNIKNASYVSCLSCLVFVCLGFVVQRVMVGYGTYLQGVFFDSKKILKFIIDEQVTFLLVLSKLRSIRFLLRSFKEIENNLYLEF